MAPAVAEFLGLDRGQGLKVDEVIDGSLAQKMGIRAGDIVLKVGSRRVDSVPDVAQGLREAKAGATITVQVNRRGKTMGLGIKKPAPKSDRKEDVDVEVDETRPKKLKRCGKVR